MKYTVKKALALLIAMLMALPTFALAEAPLDVPDDLREPLRRCGVWNGTTFAAPVAMGGYIWACNTALTDGVPANWQSAGLSPAVAEREDFRHWDAALLAMCAGRSAQAAPEGASPEMELPGIDLGLAGSATPVTSSALSF